jgi:hypothetical protein
VAEITEKLKFVLETEPSIDALHYEQALGGYLSVKPNNDNEETNLNIEILFNAAIKNKEFFKNNFIEKK